MTLQDLINLGLDPQSAQQILSSQGGGGGAAASTSASSIAGPIGKLLGAGGGFALGGPAGAGIGSDVGGILAGLIGQFAGNGVPREAKSTSIGSALEGSTNPLDALLGKFVTNQTNNGQVFSESSPSNLGNATNRIAAMVQAITGQRLDSVTGTGAFQHNPTWNAPQLGNSLKGFQLPAGYSFDTNPADFQKIFADVQRAVGPDATGGFSGKGPESEWQRVINQLISSGSLQKYQGSLGGVGGANPSGAAIPNVSLPHPLAPNQANFVQSPYPVS